MRYLITGAAGFVGSHLTKALVKDGHQVFAIEKPGAPLDSIQGVIPDDAVFNYVGGVDCLVDALRVAKPDVVFHLASLFLATHKADDIGPLVTSNVTFGVELLEAMTQAGRKNFVNTGTSWQHFQSDKYRPVCLYAATKQAFEDILAYYEDVGAIKGITLKLFDTYGPADNRQKLISALFDAAKTGRRFEMSPGEQVIDLLHVDDVVAAFRQAGELVMQKNDFCHESYALGSGQRVSLKELVDIFNKATQSSVEVVWGAKNYRDREVMIPWHTGKQLPGWSPKKNLAAGLRSVQVAQNV